MHIWDSKNAQFLYLLAEMLQICFKYGTIKSNKLSLEGTSKKLYGKNQ